MADDRSGHEPDRTSAGDEDILAEDREGEGRMYGIAVRIEDGGDIEIDVVVVAPDIGHGEGDVVGKCAGPIDADALGMGAEVTTTGHAIGGSDRRQGDLRR